jgi:hypothetical protein
LEILEMWTKTENKVSIVLILMAVASLISMLGTLRIDSIINHTLYSYGLQFSTKWAIPYWTTAAIVFSMGWFIIIIAGAFELHLLMKRWHGRTRPETPHRPQERVQKETPRTETNPNGKPEKEEAKAPITEPSSSEKSEKEEVKTTALAVKPEGELCQVQALLQELFEPTNPPVPPQKKDDEPKNQQ